jgi:hypothetical protein
MRFMMITILLLFSLNIAAQNESEFELRANQSMLMTGKGPGQDGAINPYFGQKSIAVVANTGENKVEVRVQRDGEILSITPVEKGETKHIDLGPEDELYLDTEEKTKVDLRFEPVKS